MSVIRQSVTPIIKFIAHNSESTYRAAFQTYQIFSANSTSTSGRNLQAYNFQRSTHNFSGTFSITIREDDSYDNILNNNSPFIDRVEVLDIVEIQEDSSIDRIDFRGIITNVSVTANVNSRTITISGKSIEYLLEFLSISLDVTAMKWADSLVEVNEQNLQLKTAVNNGTNSPGIKYAISEIYKSFKNVANQFSKLSNAEVIEIFEHYFTSDFIETNTTVTGEFKYPITSNLYQNSVITLYNYLRNLFPEKVYEFYGIIKNSKSQIRLREMPFLDTNEHIKNLNNAFFIKPISIVNCNLERSLDEVYTVFLSYVEGSAFSPEFYARAYANNNGVYNTQKNENKIKLYGYKPLQANFVGFNIEQAENDDVTNDLSEQLNKLNLQLKKAYENLDEMYKGSITIINIIGENNPDIGDFINFLDGRFYITSVDHSWQFGSYPRIVYHMERGGMYSMNGNFSPLKGISQKISELKS